MTDTQFCSVLNRCMPEYNPVEKIGAGSFGSVFKCERDGIYYAIKIIPVPTNDDELQMLLSRSEADEVQAYLKEKVENYRREIKLMSELKGNRSIVNIEDYKVIEAENSLGFYIVIRMELLTSLVNYASKHTLTRDEIIHLGIDICDALLICEKHNVIHRDIKPENIMIHNDGAFKLGDFGIAKQLSKTTVGTVAGTEGFMAPEVSKGAEYNHTADIYSLGILLYYYLNNKKMPYVSPDNKSIIAEQEAIVKRMNSNEVLPFPPNTDENLSKIIVKACMFNKKNRYQNAEEMQMDLIKVLHGKTVDIDLSTDVGIMMNPNNGTQNGDIYDGPFTGTMIGAKKPKSGASSGPTSEIPPDPIPQKKKKTGIIIGITAVIVVLAVVAIVGVYLMSEQPSVYVDSQGQTIQTLTKSEMEDAYTLGLQYYEQGNYENAIAELNKVTKKSGKYDEAQATMVAAMTAYKDGLIEKSNTYCDGGDFEMALSLLETGTALLGDNADLVAQQKNVLNKLKIDHINKSTEIEQKGDYAAAFSYIQTALAFLPDDVELKGLYTRLDAMATMAVALQDAENYAAMEDYAKLFSSLEDAMDDVRDSTTASSKIKLAYDEYKKSFLNSIETQIKNPTTVDEYSRAIDALNVAVEIFPNEYELKSKQESLKMMKVALDAILKADEYKSDNDYEKMFSTLESVKSEVSSDNDAYKKINDIYDRYRSEYLTNINTQIGDLETISDYDKAIRLYEDAVIVLPQDNEVSNKLKELKDNRPVNMIEKLIANSMRYYSYNTNPGSKYDKWEAVALDSKYLSIGDYKDNYENSRINALLLRTRGNYVATYVIYDCENYGELTGNISVSENSKNYNGNIHVEIYGITSDLKEELLWKKALISGIKPQDMKVELSNNYSSVKLQIVNYDAKGDLWSYNNSGDYSGILFSDLTLFK